MKVSLLFVSLFLMASCAKAVPSQAENSQNAADLNDPAYSVVPSSPLIVSSPSNPASDPNFLVLSDGTNLKSVKVSGSSLSLSRGTGSNFGASQEAQYRALKARTRDGDPKIQWVIMNLDDHVIVDRSLNTDKRMFGASASKIFVAGTILDKQHGQLSKKQLQLMSDMLVISSNTAWVELQSEIGDGNADRGRQANLDFTRRMGYHNTRGFQGNLGSIHGNELSAGDLAEFLYDTYKGHFAGADTMWKIMHTSRTGVARAKKYMPTNLFIGSKTGTYSGSTTDPETGHGTTVNVAHQVMAFNTGGKEYAIVVLADTGSNETAALLAGGLLREYTDLR
jgi:hypothetical protein